MLELKSLLKRAVDRAGIGRQVSSSIVVDAAGQFLDAAMLREVRPMAKVASYAGGCLKINCRNSVAAHEVKMLEPGIREAVMTADPKSDLRLVLAQVRSMDAYDL